MRKITQAQAHRMVQEGYGYVSFMGGNKGTNEKLTDIIVVIEKDIYLMTKTEAESQETKARMANEARAFHYPLIQETLSKKQKEDLWEEIFQLSAAINKKVLNGNRNLSEMNGHVNQILGILKQLQDSDGARKSKRKTEALNENRFPSYA